MDAVFSEIQNLHSLSRFLRYGAVTDYPESPERLKWLLAGVNKAGLSLRQPTEVDEAHLAAVHSHRYLDFLENEHAEWMKLPGAFRQIMPSVRPVETPATYPSHILGRAGWHIMDFAGAVTTQGFALMARLIAEIRLPTVIVQEGGYLTPMLGDNLAAFLTAFRQSR